MNIRGSLAIAAGAGMWGLFWIPLRYLNQQGVPGLWAVAFVLGAAALIAVPVALLKGQKLNGDKKWVVIIGLCMGLSAVFYFAAVIFSDVIRVVFLFYLLPVWATLTARLLYKIQVNGRQMLAIGIALTGLYLLLGGDGGLPLPRNVGDWFGLSAGCLWGLSLTLIREHPDLDPYAITASPFVFGASLAIFIAVLVHYLSPAEVVALPDSGTFAFLFFIALLFGAVLLWPSMFGQVWGARLVPATTAALLTMTEILVATLTAWYLIGSSMTLISLVGGGLIIVAALVDLSSETSRFGHQ